MSVLLPELEGQLRAAIRSEAAEPRRRPIGRVGVIAGLIAGVLTTTAVVVAALQLHPGRHAEPATAPATAFGLPVQPPAQLLPSTLRPGQYWYERWVEVKPAVEVVRYRGKLLQLPETRHSLYESWIGTDLRVSSREVEIGTPVFPNARDRALWLASGSPTAPPFDYRAAPLLPWLLNSYRTLRALPAQPAALLELAHQAAVRTPSYAHRARSPLGRLLAGLELNELSDLLGAPTTIATHRALLEAIAMVPGVTRRADTTDLIGRHGSSLSRLGYTIIYDPTTGAVLGDYVNGRYSTQLRSAYVTSGVVNARGALPPGISDRFAPTEGHTRPTYPAR